MAVNDHARHAGSPSAVRAPSAGTARAPVTVGAGASGRGSITNGTS